MENFKGTKGKWENIEVQTHSGRFFKIMCESVSICNIITRNSDQAEANAKLIACAPEMLNLLSSIKNDENQVPKFLWDKIEQLIKKATE